MVKLPSPVRGSAGGQPLPAHAFSAVLLPPGTRLGLAVSGGGDSVALLRLAASLAGGRGWLLHVLHVHHGLRGEAASADADFVRALASEHSLPYQQLDADAAASANAQHTGLEEAGRLLRYSWFRSLLQSGTLDAVATGHTLDDQAETCLAKLLRGAWTRGLGGISPALPAADLPGDPLAEQAADPQPAPARQQGPARTDWARVGSIVRPLLGTRREALRGWLRAIEQPWREDASNADPQYTRNRIRHELLPALAAFQPEITAQLSQLSTLARDEEQYWAGEIERLLPGLLLPGKPVRGGGRASSTLPGERSLAMEVERLRSFPVAVARRLLRATAQRLGERLNFAQTEAALALLEGSVGSVPRRAQLTARLRAERSPRELRFVYAEYAEASSAAQTVDQTVGAEIEIPIPGEAMGFGLHFALSSSGKESGSGGLSGSGAPAATLRPARPSDRATLRYSGGAPKRIKEILERMGVPPADRPGWPVIEWQGEIVWLRGAVLEPTPLSALLTITIRDAPS